MFFHGGIVERERSGCSKIRGNLRDGNHFCIIMGRENKVNRYKTDVVAKKKLEGESENYRVVREKERRIYLVELDAGAIVFFAKVSRPNLKASRSTPSLTKMLVTPIVETWG